MKYRLLIDGQWMGNGPTLEVKNKYSGQMTAALLREHSVASSTPGLIVIHAEE